MCGWWAGEQRLERRVHELAGVRWAREAEQVGLKL